MSTTLERPEIIGEYFKFTMYKLKFKVKPFAYIFNYLSLFNLKKTAIQAVFSFNNLQFTSWGLVNTTRGMKLLANISNLQCINKGLTLSFLNIPWTTYFCSRSHNGQSRGFYFQQFTSWGFVNTTRGLILSVNTSNLQCINKSLTLSLLHIPLTT